MLFELSDSTVKLRLFTVPFKMMSLSLKTNLALEYPSSSVSSEKAIASSKVSLFLI